MHQAQVYFKQKMFVYIASDGGLKLKKSDCLINEWTEEHPNCLLEE